MAVGVICPSETTRHADPETGRLVTLWTGGNSHNVGFYYHQNPFDPVRGLAYFVSDRSGAFQVWRVDMSDGTLTQVSDWPDFGPAFNYWVHVSPVSGRVYLGGRGRIAAIDPDTLSLDILWSAGERSGPDRRYLQHGYVFPSCDDRWVYSSSIFASDREVEAATALSTAVIAARNQAGLPVGAVYAESPMEMSECPLIHVIFRVEVATGRVEELWRGRWWIQHVQASPTDPDAVTFCWAAYHHPKPKYFVMRAGRQPVPVAFDDDVAHNFHDFWHPDGTRWFTHRGEGHLADPALYMMDPEHGRVCVHEVDIARLHRTGEVAARTWYEAAPNRPIHAHLNIAPDGSFLVGDGDPGVCRRICRLDWRDDHALAQLPLCEVGYPDPGVPGCEANPNTHVAPDGRTCFFTTWRSGRAYLASVDASR